MKFLLSNIISNKIIPKKLFQTITTICTEYVESLFIYACCELLVTNNNALHDKADVTLSGQYSNDILNLITTSICKTCWDTTDKLCCLWISSRILITNYFQTLQYTCICYTKTRSSKW